jgi:hypothetical protein
MPVFRQGTDDTRDSRERHAGAGGKFGERQAFLERNLREGDRVLQGKFGVNLL